MKKTVILLLFVLIGITVRAQHQQFLKKEYAGKKINGNTTNVSISWWKSSIMNSQEVWNCSNGMVYENYGNIISEYHLGLVDKDFSYFIGESVEVSLPSNAKVTSHWVSSDGSQIVSFERYPYVGEKFSAFELDGKYYVIASLFCGNGIIYVYEPVVTPAPLTPAIPTGNQNPDGENGGNTTTIDSYNTTTNNYGVGGGQPSGEYYSGGAYYSGYQGGNTARLIMFSAGRTARLIAPPVNNCRPPRPVYNSGVRPPYNHGGGRPPMTGGHSVGGGRPPMTGGHNTGGRPPMIGGHQ